MVTKDSSSGGRGHLAELAAPRWTSTALTDYANRMLVDPLSLVDGVSEVQLSRRSDPGDVRAAAPGRHGGPRHHCGRRAGCPQAGEHRGSLAADRSNTMTMAVQIARLYHSAEDFRSLPVTTAANGQASTWRTSRMWRWGQERRQRLPAQQPRSLGIGIVASVHRQPVGGGPGHREKLVEMQRFLPEGTARGRLRLHHLHQAGHRRGA